MRQFQQREMMCDEKRNRPPKLVAVKNNFLTLLCSLRYRRGRERVYLTACAFVILALAAVGPHRLNAHAMSPENQESLEIESPTRDAATMLRLLPITIDDKGQADVETVALDKEIARVKFYLDGEEVASRKKIPYAVRFPVAGERTQIVRAAAFDSRGKLIGEDSVVVGREGTPLRLRIRKAEITADGGSLGLLLDISAPEASLLDSLDVALDGTLLTSLSGDDLERGSVALSVPTEKVGQVSRGSILVTTLNLSDGRALDDAVPLGEVVFREALEVRLMQLQIVALDRAGNPIQGLSDNDFEVSENGEAVELERVFPAPDISLLLGLSIDSSGSMQRIWEQTKSASNSFLQRVMAPKDRAFLVDFDLNLRLASEATDDLDELRAGLDSIEPEGGTALYDSIVFSLLQFERQAGRRGLVLITDGIDAGSLTDPKRTIDLAQRFGVPVYIIALQQRGAGREVQARVQTLRLLTDPSGGRLFRAGSMDGVAAALDQIETELRSQYVLTYYTDQEIDWRKPPKIEVKLKDRKGAKVKTIFGVDLIE